MLTAGAAELLLAADEQRLPFVPHQLVIRAVARKRATFLEEDIELAALVVDELGWPEALLRAREYEELIEPGPALLDAYRAAWEASPYDPVGCDRVLAQAREQGCEAWLNGALHVYHSLAAPVPEQTEEQLEASRAQVRAAMAKVDEQTLRGVIAP